MQSNILNGMGLGGMDLFFLWLIPVVFSVILLVLVILLWRRLSEFSRKYEKFMRGKDAQTLEDDIFKLFDENDQLRQELTEHRRDIRRIYGTLSHSFMKLGLVKYDAFSQMGGKMSYVLALLDENNNGFLMNTVHSTENCYSYVKPVSGGQVNVDLGEEEQKALQEALGEG